MMRFIQRFFKVLVVLGLAVTIFGGAAYFGYDIFVRPHKIAEQEKSEPPPTPPPDPALPEFERCLNLKKDGKSVEAQSAFEQFVINNPNSTITGEAKKHLGELNTDLFFSATPTPDKEQYVVRPGDAIAKIERKLKTTAELIMRTNNLDNPRRLRVGQVLMVSHPDFSLVIKRKEKSVTLYNHGKFFKQYLVKVWNVPAGKSTPPIKARVTEKVAWKDGKRVPIESKDYLGSGRWITLSMQSYTLYTESDNPALTVKPPSGGIGLEEEEAVELATLLGRNTPVTIE
jgi:LysM repeat protein